MEPCGNVTSVSSSSSILATNEQITESARLPTLSSDKSRQSNSAAIHRSASCDHISNGTILNVSPEPHGIKRTLSENALASLQGGVSRQPFEQEKSGALDTGVGVHSSTRSDNKPRITISKYKLATQYDGKATYGRETENDADVVGSGRKSRSVSGSLSNFAKKSWSTASRSPSPRKRTTPLEATTLNKPRLDHARPSPSSSANKPIQNGSASDLARHSSTVGKKPRRPLSAFLGKAPAEPKIPLVPSIPKAFSTDRLPNISQTHLSSEAPPTIPKSISSDRLQSLGVDSLRKRDELWGAFRALDGEFHKFQSRPNISKTGVVRSALLPFLRTYAEHPSNTLLRPEELDRRINVLNRWWTGLLEMLNGRNGESISGNDRSAILEATTAIMVRPEWDLPPSTFIARSNKSLRPSLKSRSTTSLGSTASEFLADSVFHNVKNTFSQNLLTQMAYVVDKMSTRNVPASVVTFCGKAAAYAFFNCDGVADILVRLWATTSETLRRVLAENGIRRDTVLTSASERLIVRFPSCLHALSFKSLQSMMRYLRCQPQVPVATWCIPWNGSWVGRWAGKDTDLFFVFTKSYYSLAARHLPEDHTQEERICAPGYALLQAQILKILDATMQHPSTQPSFDHFKESSFMTFDDILGETDASAALLPISTGGIIRSMAENRLIMLLRDCLSGSFSITEKGREIFAESFQVLLKAAARRISIFDHNGCFTLCDLMEEAIVIIARYNQVLHSSHSALDWAFWFEVWRKLMESQNTMTEIRLFAFLYSLWGTITCDESRKREICLGWLLHDEFFQRQFNHWCPMVRAYFMRLLCWRVARVEGRGSELDRSVLETLQFRLESGWCHYLYLKEFSERKGLLAPSTVSCSPAPGRRLLIVRDDVQAPSSGMFLSFDNILPAQSSSSQPTSYERHSSLHSVSQAASQLARTSEDMNRSTNGGKRRWGLFKNIMNFTSATADRPRTHLPPPNPSTGKEPPGNEFGDVAKLDPNSKKGFLAGSKPSELNNPYRCHSFKFSLEWIDKENNYAGNDTQLQPPKLPVTAQKILPVLRSDVRKYEPCRPVGAAVGPSKYAGRAFAEWSDIINECQNFFERRRNEGVPTSSKVETPTLGVESFRKFG